MSLETRTIHEQTANELIELEEKIHDLEKKAFLDCINAKDSELKAVYRERLGVFGNIRHTINKQIHFVVTGKEED